jgi:predicted phosphodiesterase
LNGLYTNYDNPDLKFGVFADPQFCDCKPDLELNRFFKNSASKLEKCVDHFNKNEQLDFVIGLGDLIDKNFESFKKVNSILANLNRQLFQIPGNHDFEVEKENLNRVYQQFGLLDKTYFSFIKSGWQFIFLDGNDITFNTINPIILEQAEKITRQLKKANKPNYGTYNGAIGQKQLHWFVKQLHIAEKNQLNTAVICHFPLLPFGQFSLWNTEEILSILFSHKTIKFWINGHHHEGNYAVKNGIHFVTLKAMVDTEQETSFAEITLSKDTIQIQGYGRESNRLLKIN